MAAEPPAPPAADPAPSPAGAGAGSAAPLAALKPVQTLRRRWPALLGAVVTAAMLGGLAGELFGQGLAGLRRAVPTAAGFYLFFLISYFALPVADFVIFRRLWHVPAGAFGALNRKRIANDVLVGYSGDAYFYAWARARTEMVAAPFGAVKDVTIVSGIAGNVSAIVLGAVALPLGYELIEPATLRTILWSMGLATGLTLAFLLFSSRVFSLPRRQLWFIFGVDMLRIVVNCVTIAIAWSFAMPTVSVGLWLFLIAGRQLVSRLPLVPNKDLLFANFAILFIGQDQALSDLMAFTAASTLLVHMLIIAVVGIEYLVERTQAWRHEG